MFKLVYFPCISSKTFESKIVADLHREISDALPLPAPSPPIRPNFFHFYAIFMEIFVEKEVDAGYSLELVSLLWEILDPSL